MNRDANTAPATMHLHDTQLIFAHYLVRWPHDVAELLTILTLSMEPGEA